MSVSKIRSTLAGIMLAAAAGAAQAGEPEVLAPDVAGMMTGICTANAAVLETLGDNADPKLRAAYKAENAGYARQITQSGFNAGPCNTL